MHLDFEGGPRTGLGLAVLFLFVMVGVGVDLFLDRPDTWLSLHVALEVMIVLVSLGAATYLAAGWYATRMRLAEEVEASHRLREERQQWEDRASDVLATLGSAISDRFDGWDLTPTERKVALMILKGLSHKRIARVTGTSERTVRQHAVAVYRKSGLNGRAALAGFFLEPLLLPEESEILG